jgi:hypothetical protein
MVSTRKFPQVDVVVTLEHLNSIHDDACWDLDHGFVGYFHVAMHRQKECSASLRLSATKITGSCFVCVASLRTFLCGGQGRMVVALKPMENLAIW